MDLQSITSLQRVPEQKQPRSRRRRRRTLSGPSLAGIRGGGSGGKGLGLPDGSAPAAKTYRSLLAPLLMDDFLSSYLERNVSYFY